MKSVLISIQPKWCELIANGKKTVEVRNTKPKLETPFKVYIYCTNNGGSLHTGYGGLYYHKSNMGKNDSSCINGKVIGEFVCDRITEYECSSDGFGQLATTCGTCLTYDEIINYCNGNELYGWHISNLVIYDKPRELGEFYKPCIDEEYQYCPCCKYGHEIFSPDEVECSSDVPGAQYEQICLNRIKRPPQSWCYVESEVQGE